MLSTLIYEIQFDKFFNFLNIRFIIKLYYLIAVEIILDGSLRVTQGDYYTVELYNRTSQLFYSKAHTYKIMVNLIN